MPRKQDQELRGQGHRNRADKALRFPPSSAQTDTPGGQAARARKGQTSAAPRRTPSSDEGQSTPADKADGAAPSSAAPNGEAGLSSIADKASDRAPDLAVTIALIRAKHRERSYAMEMRKRADLSLLSYLRMVLGWRRDLPDTERSRIAAQAKALVEIGEADAKGKPVDVADYEDYRSVILASIAARAPFDAVEKAATRDMERLAATLPVWTAWGEGIRGFGARSLGVIVGEAGDLGTYPKKGHLWKRMGLAVIGDGDGFDDVRQGGLGKGASKDDWIAHGYSALRRSRMYVIGDVLVKTAGPYREIYLRRKEYERAKAEAAGFIVAPSAKIPAKSAALYRSDGHVHRRAQRYIEKILLRDLRAAWRRAKQGVPEGPKNPCPSPEIQAAA